MATKYMGAKMLQKQLKKQAAAAAKKDMKKQQKLAAGEHQDISRRVKRIFVMEGIDMQEEKQPTSEEQAAEPPTFIRALNKLRRNRELFMTQNDVYLDGVDSDDSEEDPDKVEIHEMLRTAQT